MTVVVVLLLLAGVVLASRASKIADRTKARTWRRGGIALAVAAFVLAVVGAFDVGRDHAENNVDPVGNPGD